MTPRIDAIIDGLKEREGGYVNNPDDPGGPTKWGITERVARRHGYKGNMEDYPWAMARVVYFFRYVSDPRFGEIAKMSGMIAEELIDTGVNMGVAKSGRFLQQALRSFNHKGRLYPDIEVDGIVGDKTISALESYLNHRGSGGEIVMVKALNCLQGAEYIRLAEADDRYETFVYGWVAKRIGLGDHRNAD